MLLLDMPCALCTVRNRRGQNTMYLLPADGEMREILIGKLNEHRVGFEPESNLLALSALLDPSRVIDLLGQVLSQPEREGVRVLETDGSTFPNPRSLDDWQLAERTEWFADAMANDRFETWFQPIFDTDRRGAFAHECLIRLRGGRIYGGAEILAAARGRREIHSFDAHARKLAIRSAAREPMDGLCFINLLPASVYNPESCLRETLTAITDCGLAPGRIVFEVAEQDTGRDGLHVRRLCDFLRARGLGIALDNAGGAGSLRMLGDLRPDFVKIDRSIVADMEQPVYAATVRKLVEIAERLGITIIGTGVETSSAVENLWLLGVRHMQGYYLGRPFQRPANDREPPAPEILPHAVIAA